MLNKKGLEFLSMKNILAHFLSSGDIVFILLLATVSHTLAFFLYSPTNQHCETKNQFLYRNLSSPEERISTVMNGEDKVLQWKQRAISVADSTITSTSYKGVHSISSKRRRKRSATQGLKSKTFFVLFLLFKVFSVCPSPVGSSTEKSTFRSLCSLKAET